MIGLSEAEEQAWVDQACASLSEPSRTILTMTARGRTDRDIASHCQLPLGIVRDLLERALCRVDHCA